MRKGTSLPAAALFALVGFSLLTLLVFRPTAYELAHTAPSYDGRDSDALLLMWATSHVSDALFDDPLNLFDGGIFHPARHSLAYGDHMIGEALVGMPIWLATRNPLLEYNLLCLASYVLGATALFLYAHRLYGNPWAAAAGGVVFVFTPFRFQSPLWLQILFTPFMPLTLLYWLRFVEARRTRDWWCWVGCWTLHSLMGMYLALLFAITMGTVALYGLVAARRVERRLLLGTLLAPPAVLILLSPTLWPYMVLRAVQGQVREMFEVPVSTIFLPGPGTLTGRLSGLEGIGQVGPGIVVWALVMVGLIVAWRRDRPTATVFVPGAHAVGLAVSIGLCVLPARVYAALPGLDALRVHNRAFLISLMFLGLFVAEGVAWLAARPPNRRARWAVSLGLLLLLLADMGRPHWERSFRPVGDEVPPQVKWLQQLDGDVAVYERGLVGVLGPPVAMYYAIFHGKRITSGYSGFFSPASDFVHYQMAGFPDAAARAMLAKLEVDYVLWNFFDPTKVEPFLERVLGNGVELAARFEHAVILRVDRRGREPFRISDSAPLDPAAWEWNASENTSMLGGLLDRDLGTIWRAPVIPGGSAPWLEVDLGRPHWIGGVRSTPSDPRETTVFRARVEMSLDGREWNSIDAVFWPDSLVDLFERPDELEYFEARFPAQPARFVRLVHPARGHKERIWEIAELELLGDCGREPELGCTRESLP